VVTVVQARRGSTRLPDKVLLPLAGAPALVRQLERVRSSALAGTVVVATTIECRDDTIEDLCREEKVLCFRGHPTDLLDRHYQVARALGADHVVKIPSDCPLIDPRVIDRVLDFYLRRPGWFEYVSNLHPATYPDGNDVEILSFEALQRAAREAVRPAEREHTTPYLWDNPDRFRVGNVPWETGLDYSMSHRWTLDYPEDYEFLRRVYDELYRSDGCFSMSDVLELLERQPDLGQINARLRGVNWYRHHLHELKTISPDQTRDPVTVPEGA
jgi:spore coat polysaccharide biosynthesis protein SpsF